MRKLILSLVALAVVASPLALTAAPASANAGSPLCMTKAEWRLIKVGMSQTRVRNIVGNWGKVTDRTDFADGEVWITREYRQCNAKGRPTRGSWNIVDISFGNVRNWDNDWNPIIGAQRVDYKGAWSTPWF